jgi:hypothetical protein
MRLHYERSTYREKLLEHLFVGELLKCLWAKGITEVECLRPEVDGDGYDLALAFRDIIRHVQLKASYHGAKTSRQKIHVHLAGKPSGCVIWIVFDEQTLQFKHFLWFGGSPGEPLPSIDSFQVARHTKGNSQGTKLLRPKLRVAPRRAFTQIASMEALVAELFGSELSLLALPPRRPLTEANGAAVCGPS